MSSSGWRPPQWSQPQLYSITVTTQQSTQTSVVGNQMTDESGNVIDTGNTQTTPGSSSTSTTIYYFDAVLSADHYTTRRFTDHPIQSGASVTDHSFQLPDRVILEVGFSDVMQSYQVGQYGGGNSKSVSAYQTFVQLQKTGTQLKLSTRLQQYPIMGIEEIRAPDSNATTYGARFTIVLKQLIIANLSTTQVQSARPDASQQTSTGTQQSTSVPNAVTNSHTTGAQAFTPPSAPNVPNPNPDWSSDPIAPSSIAIVP
jgi:Dit-like tail protein